MASRRQTIREHIALQKKLEAEWRNKVFWALRRSKKPFFDAAERSGLQLAQAMGSRLIDRAPIRKVLERLYIDVATPAGIDAFTQGMQLKQSGFYASQAWLELIRLWFGSFIENLTTDICNTTWKNIVETISKGVQDGTSYNDIVRKLLETVQDRRRAALIARTEVNKSLAWAKYEAAGKLPYPVILEWVSATDNRTRGTNAKDKTDHRALDGKRVDYGQPFTDPRSGSQMRFPGDTALGAGAGDIVNCRCTLITRRKR